MNQVSLSVDIQFGSPLHVKRVTIIIEVDLQE